MKKSNSICLSIFIVTLVMTVFSSSVQAQAPGVRERSEARRDREGTNVGKSRKAEREHNQRMSHSKKAADDYKKSNKDSAAKQRYQDSKKQGGW